MTLLELVILGIALSMDCFAASIATGIVFPKMKIKSILRMVLIFGFAHFFMPVVGYIAGYSVINLISRFDHWLACGLLILIGGKMLYEAWKGEIEEIPDPSKGWLLLILAVATSIDNLAAGLNLAIIKMSLWGPSILFGFTASTFTLIGVVFGKNLGRRFGRSMLILGGLILIAIGINIVLSHNR